MKKLLKLDEFGIRIGNGIMFQFIQFLDKFIGNLLNYELKTTFLTIPRIGDRPPILANLVANLETLY